MTNRATTEKRVLLQTRVPARLAAKILAAAKRRGDSEAGYVRFLLLSIEERIERDTRRTNP